MLLYISIHAHWKYTIHAEIQALLARYTSPSEPLHKWFSAIPISVWKDATTGPALIVNFTHLHHHVPSLGEIALNIPQQGVAE